jgi:uncharacterized membrane protein
MIGTALALGSAVCFGIADYAGGLLARKANAASVALAVQASGLVLLVLVAPLVPAPGAGWRDLAWGALSGVGTAVGLFFLYRGLTRGRMSIVVPLSTVGSVVLPVLVGVVLLGEQPSLLSWIGIGFALPAIALVTGIGGKGGAEGAGPAVDAAAGGEGLDGADGAAAAYGAAAGGAAADGAAPTVDALVSSLGFALQYVALAQAGSTAGLWPVASGRVASVATLLALSGVLTARARVPRGLVVPVVLNGAVAAAGLTLYMVATRQGIMAVAVVLSSLYPVIPVLLGVVVLRERLTGRQVLGLLGAAVTVALVASG